jgi:hypothetical protein
MTVSSSVNRNDYAGNGSTTNFAVSFRFLQNSDVKATLRDASGVETLQVETTNYALTGAGDAGGGTLVMLVAPPTGTTLTIQRDVPATQETDYVENDEFPAESHEDALDKLTMLVQQNIENSERHFGFSDTVSDASDSVTLTENAAQRSGLFLAFDSSGDLEVTAPPQVLTADAIFSNTGQMKAASLTSGVTADTRGFTTAGDDAGARYLILTAAEFGGTPDEINDVTLDNGDIAVNQSSSLFRDGFGVTYLKTTSDLINGDEVSLMRFIDPTKHSAIRDQTSTSDVSADVQDAITTVISSGAGLFNPAGLYNIDTGLDVAGNGIDRFYMRGQGRRTKFKTTNAISVFDLNGIPSNTFQHARLSEFAIEAANVSANCILSRDTELMQLKSMVFLGSGIAGVNMSPTASTSDIKPMIHDCIFGGLQHGILGGDTRQADGSYKDNFFIDTTSSCITMGWPDGGTFTGNKFFSNNAGANAVRGFDLKKPIWCFVEDNDFFELGGIGLKLTSPRHSRFNNNRFVNVGQSAALSAISVLDFDATVAGVDNQFIGNTLKDINGPGITISSSASIQTSYKISDNYFANVGNSGTVHDAISLTNCADFEIRRNQIFSDEVTNKTRFWLNLNASTDITIQGNTREGLGNPDLFKINTVTLTVEDSRRILTGVVATTTINFDDDGMIGGVLTGSITMNLPAANSCSGKLFTARWTSGAFDIVLDPAAAQTIDGASTLNVNSGAPKVTIISDGANWFTL